MKNSFLGLASHELKTPLTIIMGYVELLLDEMSSRLDDSTREMLRHIGRASERLAEIVRDMVDVSMLDKRTLELATRNSMSTFWCSGPSTLPRSRSATVAKSCTWNRPTPG